MVSVIGDNFKDDFPDKWSKFWPLPPTPSNVSEVELAALRKEVRELKKLLKAAKAFDKATGQPHCEMDEKVALIKAIAKMLEIDLGDVFET